MISVIIPAHNKPHRLNLTLAGLQGQKNRSEFEILVVADNATGAVTEVLDRQPHCRIVSTPGLGRAGARNFGADAAGGDPLIFIDDDILVQNNFVISHIQAQKREQGLVHGQLREIIGLIKVENPSLGGPGCAPVDLNELSRGHWQPGNMRLVANALEQAAEKREQLGLPWLACAGANISIPKKFWQKVGGFREAYGKRWGMEDIDFAYRLWEVGVPISLSYQAKGFHMSHYRESRWDEHAINFDLFKGFARCREARALEALLSPDGSFEKFAQRLRQIRKRDSSPPC